MERPVTARYDGGGSPAPGRPQGNDDPAAGALPGALAHPGRRPDVMNREQDTVIRTPASAR